MKERRRKERKRGGERKKERGREERNREAEYREIVKEQRKKASSETKVTQLTDDERLDTISRQNKFDQAVKETR